MRCTGYQPGVQPYTLQQPPQHLWQSKCRQQWDQPANSSTSSTSSSSVALPVQVRHLPEACLHPTMTLDPDPASCSGLIPPDVIVIVGLQCCFRLIVHESGDL